MKWHKDTLLYEKPQYEAIYTIDNLSESETEWMDDKDNLNSMSFIYKGIGLKY